MLLGAPTLLVDELVMAYLVVRIRGTVNIPYWAQTTLDSLNLDKKFRATIIAENPNIGYAKKIKDIVAWTSVDAKLRQRIVGKERKKNGFKPY